MACPTSAAAPASAAASAPSPNLASLPAAAARSLSAASTRRKNARGSVTLRQLSTRQSAVQGLMDTARHVTERIRHRRFGTLELNDMLCRGERSPSALLRWTRTAARRRRT